WDGDKGVLSEVRTVSALPADFKGTSVSAEIAIHPNGKFLYATNRGDDSVAVFAIDPDNGNLSQIEHIPTRGKTPRNFAIDPTGQWLIVTNHDSNNGSVFKVDQQTGRLTAAGDPFSVAYPFCERFLPLP
ncbi:MAG: beta-propeller fold lactonase family protein, partial [Tepidisphaeraceae bacterium]